MEENDHCPPPEKVSSLTFFAFNEFFVCAHGSGTALAGFRGTERCRARLYLIPASVGRAWGWTEFGDREEEWRTDHPVVIQEKTFFFVVLYHLSDTKILFFLLLELKSVFASESSDYQDGKIQ